MALRGGRGGAKGTAPGVTCAPNANGLSEPTLSSGRGAGLASPGQRASPAPCDPRWCARWPLFRHGESGARVAVAGQPRPTGPGRSLGSRPLGSCGQRRARPEGRQSRAEQGRAAQDRAGRGVPGKGSWAPACWDGRDAAPGAVVSAGRRVAPSPAGRRTAGCFSALVNQGSNLERV